MGERRSSGGGAKASGEGYRRQKPGVSVCRAGLVKVALSPSTITVQGDSTVVCLE